MSPCTIYKQRTARTRMKSPNQTGVGQTDLGHRQWGSGLTISIVRYWTDWTDYGHPLPAQTNFGHNVTNWSDFVQSIGLTNRPLFIPLSRLLAHQTDPRPDRCPARPLITLYRICPEHWPERTYPRPDHWPYSATNNNIINLRATEQQQTWNIGYLSNKQPDASNSSQRDKFNSFCFDILAES